MMPVFIEEEEFRSQAELDNFLFWLDEHLEAGDLVEIAVPRAQQAWSRRRRILYPLRNRVYELIVPAPPFFGSFRQVETAR